MNEKLYDMMDWARIEGLVYSEEDHPHDFLGAHVTDEGVLIQTFIPTAEKIEVITGQPKTSIPMEKEDEAGFFALLLPGDRVPEYQFSITFDDGSVRKIRDPYGFEPQLTREETKEFNAGICYDIYEKLGAHPMTIDGTEGVYFAVWAPNAVRVSLVGDFNLWDGRRLPMRRLWDSGIFELFVPGLVVGTLYKYEIKAKGGLTFLKADPYGFAAELRPDTASVVTDLGGFEWEDLDHLLERRKRTLSEEPMFSCEIHLGSFARPRDGREFYNYRELAPMVAEYVKKSGYTHIELMPVMEYYHDETAGFQTAQFYAPTARYGSPQDFMYFMNYMHKEGIGVILDWAPEHFASDIPGLCGFDGTCLYEHQDPRQGLNPKLGTRIFNYARPEVSNFLIANALFWVKVYHADGLRVNNATAMLYLDYDRTDGQWVANMYGGNENLDAVEFLRHLGSVFRRRSQGAVLIAKETSCWDKATSLPEEEGLGFDFKWNDGWTSDFLSYMQLDPVFRGYHHGELIFSMVYQYSEKFMLTISHEEVGADKGALLVRLPGRREMKFANLRAAIAYMTVHPGKKMLFMGQELGSFDPWKYDQPLDWELGKMLQGTGLQAFMTDLLKLYRSEKALFEKDFDPEGFEWINNISGNENMLVFLRKGSQEADTLLIVCNFSPLKYENHKIGVPMRGSYKEIFNSDREIYGGSGAGNPRAKVSKKDECDGRPDSIRITVPPMSVCIFRCSKAKEKDGTALKPQTKAESKAPAKAKAASAAKKAAAGSEQTKAASAAKKTAVGAEQTKAGSAAKKTAAGAEQAKTGAAAKKSTRKTSLKEELEKKFEQEEKKL